MAVKKTERIVALVEPELKLKLVQIAQGRGPNASMGEVIRDMIKVWSAEDERRARDTR